ncbi:fungal-specific transcription factor domain-containing protein [Collybia nuda]|uniref:Fungal-specific transcription factor domain-containing protein n=1 Tax=Collybia nuda TaxID=64659 RepID=A0A9P5YAD4_9AGAR|nr:fungal-specific transcription factor domain-containing protein [Collybia nuda]
MQGTKYTYPQPGPSQNHIEFGASRSSDFPGSLPGLASHFQGSFDHVTNPSKKRRVDRACDACRRRKIKCDGPKMPGNTCSNCLQTKKPCTYVEDSKPRGPSKASHVAGLEDRMEKLETLLKQLHPGTDFTTEIGPPVIRDSWKNEESSTIFQEHPYSPSSPSYPRKSSHSSPIYSSPSSQGHIRTRINASGIGLPHFGRSTHLVFGSQPTRGSHLKPDHLHSDEDTDDDDSDDNQSSSSDHSASSLTLEIENVTGLVKKLKLRGTEDDSDQPPENNNRFHGKSSAVGLVEATRQFKLLHLLDSLESARPSRESPQGIEDLPLGSLTRRPEFWRTPKWERVWESLKIESSELFTSVLAGFPPSDLAQSLIHLYFVHVNAHIPLLHRPTFERQWGENLHHKNIWFAAVCISLFAVASRFTDDLRVTERSGKPDSGQSDWGYAGWNYFEVAIGIHRARRSLFYPASLFEIQTFTLLGMFLRGTESPSAAWILVSIGIRKAQDVGAHRQNVYRNKPTVDEELWKRAIWCLIVFDRIGGAVLGRGCGVGEEDFDIDLPLEVDDEYWESEDPCEAFRQPPEIPAKVGAFNLFIKLSQIVAFALKTTYALDKSRIFSGMPRTDWRRDVLNQLNAAMSDWKTLVPNHLIWSPQMPNKEFTVHAATLQTFYHFTEMLIYRPFISLLAPTFSDISPLDQAPSPDPTLPAMDICVEAARSCARIAEAQIQHGISLVPIMMHVAQISAATLLIRVWDLKSQEKDHQAHGLEDVKPPFIQRIDPLLTDIGIFIRVLEWAAPRWRFISTILPQLKECLPAPELQTNYVRLKTSP